MKSLEKARTRWVSEVGQQYYHKKMYTWKTEEEWREQEREKSSQREREEEGELESDKNCGKKGDGLLKNGRKSKQSELKTGGEMEMNESEVSEVVGVVKLSETEACTEDQDEEESVTVGVKFLEKVFG
jgi:hypothetical protein